MRRKIVLWGSNEKEDKMLVALELLEKENVVNIFTFPQQIATEEFYKDMTDKWRDDIEVEFPTGFTKIERKLSVSDSLLPDDIRVERTDLISRAQAEWHFVVLSSKLYGLYKSELEELKEKVETISEYDNVIWEDLKSFWSKVQDQVNEKNLFREHGAALREKTNHLFDKLKEFRKVLEEEVEKKSKSYLASFTEELKEIESKIENGLGLSPLFEELKNIQTKSKDINFTKGDKNIIWKRIDHAFKKLKEKRSSAGKSGGHQQFVNNNLARLEGRYKGLMGAIHKMQHSIDFDRRDLDFQAKKVADSDGQLESQLRQAKIRMIEERVKSKQEKLDDMHLTKTELEGKLEKEKMRAVKFEKNEKLKEAKEVIKLKIASEISENAKEMDKISDKLEKAASEILPIGKKPASSMIDNLTESAAQLVEDVVDTAKAIAEVVEDKMEDAKDMLEDLAENAGEKLEDTIDKAEDLAEAAEDKLEALMDKAEGKLDEIKAKLSGNEEEE
ncbi:MAG: hypothetical protein WAU01_15775 [Saprospiraceae bacterium]